jgi:hypothetical protein
MAARCRQSESPAALRVHDRDAGIGYLGSSFTKYPILYWGIKLPQWGWDSPALKDLFSQIHYVTVIIFIALIALHVAAALKHWLIDRDGIVRRMWFAPREAPAADIAPASAGVR